MKMIILADEQYETLCNELASLEAYHWNDNSKHADACGSKILYELKEHSISEEEKDKILSMISVMW